jgi:cytidylate kinase
MTFIKELETYEQELRKKYAKKGITITVSGLAASGKSTGAKALAEAFNLEYVSAGRIMREIAQGRNISLLELSKSASKDLDLEIDRKSLEYALKGNCVIEGRLAGWVAGENADVRIVYITPLEVRIRRMAERENISIELARKEVIERDESDRKRYREYYGIDLDDLSIYQIRIDNSSWSLEDAKTKPVKLVRNFLKEKGLI